MKDEKLIKQIHSAILDMMSNVKMSKDHVYTNTKTGDWYQGVSEVSSIIPKDWLAAWGGKEAVKFLGYSDYKGDTKLAIEMRQKIIDCKTVEEYQAILRDAKGSSRRKSKEALVDGKEGHLWLSQFLLAEIRKNK